jgi:hypothetical protein
LYFSYNKFWVLNRGGGNEGWEEKTEEESGDQRE